jgi:polysaccharide pyruvyl transferase WcaK-like protein
MKVQSIAFLGLFGQKNLGNECTLQAMIYHARRLIPEAGLKCICTGPEDTKARHGIEAFEMFAPSGNAAGRGRRGPLGFIGKAFSRAWREFRHGAMAFKTLKDTDLLIVPGTGLLVDHTTGFQGYPYYVFKWILIAKLRRCKILVLSVGAGPLGHRLSRFLVKKALVLADYRSYRDAFSKEYLAAIGLATRDDPICPDLAFSLPENLFFVSRDTGSSRITIGVGLIDYHGQGARQASKGYDVYRDYINRTSAFITWLLDHGYRVRLLIGDRQYDAQAFHDIKETLAQRGHAFEEGCVVGEIVDTVEDLVTQLAMTDLVVSPRYHNIILSMMLKKAVLSLSYNEKFEALMHDIGMDGYCQRLDELDVDRLIARLKSMESDRRELEIAVGEKAERYRQALNDQYERIFRRWGGFGERA